MEDVAGHTTQRDRIREAVEEVLTGTDLYLVDFDLRGQKGSQVLDVFIDADERLDVSRLAGVSRELGFLLETQELMPGRYHLNVSSPGADRPLVLPRQFPKHIGRTLRVTYRLPDAETPETAVGELRGVDDEGIDLAVPGAAPRRLPFATLIEAKVQLPW